MLHLLKKGYTSTLEGCREMKLGICIRISGIYHTNELAKILLKNFWPSYSMRWVRCLTRESKWLMEFNIALVAKQVGIEKIFTFSLRKLLIWTLSWRAIWKLKARSHLILGWESWKLNASFEKLKSEKKLYFLAFHSLLCACDKKKEKSWNFEF